MEPNAAPVLRKVLVIHHSREALDALALRLRSSFDIRKAPDGEMGWQAVLVDQSISAVVASLPVLELDGYGLMQRIRGSKATRISRMPIVIMSEKESSSLDELAISFGASDVIPPETGADELCSRLNALIDPTTASARGKRIRTVPKLVHSRSDRASSLAPSVAIADPAPQEPPLQKTAAIDIATGSPASPPNQELSMARFDNLNKVLKTLQSSSPGVEASALISSDGLMIASALPQDLDDARVAGMTATLLSLGSRAATELRRGEISEVIVRGELGYAVMINAGRGALLLVLATEATPLGLIFFDMREAIKAIKTIL